MFSVKFTCVDVVMATVASHERWVVVKLAALVGVFCPFTFVLLADKYLHCFAIYLQLEAKRLGFRIDLDGKLPPFVWQNITPPFFYFMLPVLRVLLSVFVVFLSYLVTTSDAWCSKTVAILSSMYYVLLCNISSCCRTNNCIIHKLILCVKQVWRRTMPCVRR